ncbi:MAG: hypothetical protein D3925_00725 [Candidatus Electrothrix sp. AR5]|nr:hypothetical protein [Candidatus Electrothrix sp. AR5]
MAGATPFILTESPPPKKKIRLKLKSGACLSFCSSQAKKIKNSGTAMFEEAWGGIKSETNIGNFKELAREVEST